jgi:hypothetical protein
MEHLIKNPRFGKLYYPHGHLDICLFAPPSHASLKPVIIKALDSGDYLSKIIFLENGYLKLRIELAILEEEMMKSS